MTYASLLAHQAGVALSTAHHPGWPMPDLTPTDGIGTSPDGPVELFLDYRLEDEIPVNGFVQQNLERWAVSVSVRGAGTGQERAEIGCARVLIANLEAGRDVRDLTDAVSGAWVDRGSTSSVKAVSHVLVLERVWLRPDHRGGGFGPIIAAAVIDRLGRGCHLAACYPAPFEEGRQGLTRETSIEALGRIWARVGFRHWTNGVWMLDLHQHDTRATLAALITARAISGTPGTPDPVADQDRHDPAPRHSQSSYRSRTG